MLQEPSACTSIELGHAQAKPFLGSSLGMQKWLQVALVQAMLRSEIAKLFSEIARWNMSAAEEMLDKEVQETSLMDPLTVTQKSTALSFSTQ